MAISKRTHAASSTSHPNPPQTTDRAELMKRQGSNPSFVGYFIGPSNTTPQYCFSSGGGYFVSSGSYANCCGTDPTASCNYITTCLGSTAFVNILNLTYSCARSNPCVTQTIYQEFPNSGIMRSIGCQTDFPFTDQTVYRNLGVLTSSAKASTSTRLSPSTTQDSSQSNSPTSINPIATPLSGTPRAENKAWIAGAVIGPIALVVIAGIFFYIRKLRRRPAEPLVMVEEPKYAGEAVEIYTAPMKTPRAELA